MQPRFFGDSLTSVTRAGKASVAALWIHALLFALVYSVSPPAENPRPNKELLSVLISLKSEPTPSAPDMPVSQPAPVPAETQPSNPQILRRRSKTANRPTPSSALGRATEPNSPLPTAKANSSLRMRGTSKHIDLSVPGAFGAVSPSIGASAGNTSGIGRGSGHRIDIIGVPPSRIGESMQENRARWQRNGDGTLSTDQTEFVAKIGRDGRMKIRDMPQLEFNGIRTDRETLVPVLDFRMDLTGAVQALLGEELYVYRKKKMLEQTFDMRQKMAASYQEEQLQTALAGFKKRLHKIWRNKRLSLTRRKQILFALWDECAESGPEGVVATAQAIRRVTMGFIRAKLPPGSPQGFSRAELAQLNRRRQSSAVFAP